MHADAQTLGLRARSARATADARASTPPLCDASELKMVRVRERAGADDGLDGARATVERWGARGGACAASRADRRARAWGFATRRATSDGARIDAVWDRDERWTRVGDYLPSLAPWGAVYADARRRTSRMMAR